MKTVEDSLERWSCSVPCVWSGSLQTRLALTQRMYSRVFWRHKYLEFLPAHWIILFLSFYCTGPVFPSWPIMCFTAMSAITAVTHTFLENKQVSGPYLPKTRTWNCIFTRCLFFFKTWKRCALRPWQTSHGGQERMMNTQRQCSLKIRWEHFLKDSNILVLLNFKPSNKGYVKVFSFLLWFYILTYFVF